MSTLLGDIRYALRGFRQAPGFTTTAILTLALGIGGTTAIFSLMHAVMLRSLPVADPASLYRIGEGNDCCVEGGPQDRWGMYSFPLFERLKAATARVRAVDGLPGRRPHRLSVLRAETERAPRSLRGEFVTGNYFSRLRHPALWRTSVLAGRRPPLRPARRRAQLPRLAGQLRRRPRRWSGSAFIDRRAAVHHRRHCAAGLLRRNAAQRSTRFLAAAAAGAVDPAARDLSCASPYPPGCAPSAACKPGATVDGMSPRLTGAAAAVDRSTTRLSGGLDGRDSKMMPKQSITVVPAGAGVGEMREQYGRSLQILLVGLRPGVADRLRQRGESAARARHGAAHADLGAARRRAHRGLASSGRRWSRACCWRVAGGVAGLFVAIGAQRLLLAMAFRNARPTCRSAPLRRCRSSASRSAFRC